MGLKYNKKFYYLINANKNEKKLIEQEKIFAIISDICLGLKEIHSKGIIHRDLKPENIFITKDNRIKIGDFGISKKLKETMHAKTFGGTLSYAVPEILNKQKYTNKIDVWSLGCILYELCTLNYCFYDENFIAVCNKIINEEHGKIDLKFYKTEWQNLIDKLLKKDFKLRPDINELYKLLNKILPLSEMTIQYTINDDETIRIFGDKFVENNKK